MNERHLIFKCLPLCSNSLRSRLKTTNKSNIFLKIEFCFQLALVKDVMQSLLKNLGLKEKKSFVSVH